MVITCAIPDPMRPPPTTVTVLIAYLEVELEKFLVKPINLVVCMFGRSLPANTRYCRRPVVGAKRES